MFNKNEGFVQNVAGRVQEAFGSATGDTSTQLGGKARRAVGAAQYGLSDFVDEVRDVASKNPVETVAIVAGVCFVLGAIWSRR